MSETLRDRIIKSETADRMLSRVSPIYDNSYVGLWMYEAIGREYDSLWDIVRSLPEQLYPESVTWAIELWEQRYGITPRSNQTLEERRQAIIAARSIPAPFLPATLERYIYNLTGRIAHVIDYVRDFTFGVEILDTPGMRTSDFNAIIAYINRHKPSHMSYDLVFLTEAEITIGIETGYWRFSYAPTNTTLTGLLPEVNTVYGACSGGIRIHGAGEGYHIPYPLAGTRPETDVIGAVGAGAITIAPEAKGHPFAYTPAGKGITGTRPETNVIFGAAAANIIVAAAAQGYPFGYTPAGTKPDVNVFAALGDGRIAAHGDGQGHRFGYTPAGLTPEQSTFAKLADGRISAAGEGHGIRFGYALAGTPEGFAGTHPEFVVTGELRDNAISAAYDGEAYTIGYTPCGTKTTGAGKI